MVSHPLYAVMLEALRVDARQMIEEGHNIASIETEIEKAAASRSLEDLAALQMDLWSRPSPPEFRYVEPNDWDSIAKGFPDADDHDQLKWDDAEIADRILGAWQGRCVGCQLGKPVEGLTEPETVREALKLCGSWPLEDYINPLPEAATPAAAGSLPARLAHWQHITRGRMRYVEPDDDIHYAITALRVLEKQGVDFTSADIAEEIRRLTPQGILFASGLNMVKTAAMGMTSPLTGLFGNACRQSLGAMIRCDAFGWVSPGNPKLAAELAFRDAIGSQRRNGIYASMFFAALIADVFRHGDPCRAIENASAHVPGGSRFTEMVEYVRNTCETVDDWSEANEVILDRYHRHLLRADGVVMNHCLPNAAVCIMALLKGEGDFSRTITIGVMAGMDTDCNGATLGSIMGATLGTQGIAQKWTEPLNDTIRTELMGMHKLRISNLASRTFAVAKKQWMNKDSDASTQ